jgi:hypothetical protein
VGELLSPQRPPRDQQPDLGDDRRAGVNDAQIDAHRNRRVPIVVLYRDPGGDIDEQAAGLVSSLTERT